MKEYSQYLSQGMNELLHGAENNLYDGQRIIASNLKGDCMIGQSAVMSSSLNSTKVGDGTVIEFSSVLGIVFIIKLHFMYLVLEHNSLVQ